MIDDSNRCKEVKVDMTELLAVGVALLLTDLVGEGFAFVLERGGFLHFVWLLSAQILYGFGIFIGRFREIRLESI